MMKIKITAGFRISSDQLNQSPRYLNMYHIFSDNFLQTGNDLNIRNAHRLIYGFLRYLQHVKR